MLLITGANGQLGRELAARIPDAVLTDSEVLDITDENAVMDFVKKNNIDVIVNCAAYTAVDKAEDEADVARRVNVDGPKNLAKTGAKIIHISTDYVFDGTAHQPYAVDANTSPVSVYGKTKRAGELAVLENASCAIVIRTAWLYSAHGNNFVKTMRRLGAEKDVINVVADQIGTPTFAGDLADAIVQIIPQIKPENSGVYHFTNEGVCSWFDFATEIMEMSGLGCVVNPIKSHQYPTRATRPFYSVLDKDKIKDTFGIKIQHWKKGVEKCLKQF